MYTVVLMMAMSGSGDATAFSCCSCACTGSRCSGCNGCQRSWGCQRSRCHGCNGGCSCSGRVYSRCNGCCSSGCSGMRTGGVEVVPAPRRPEEVSGPRAATIVVSLPADARLLVDDQPTTSTSAQRRFTTPPLEPGATYFYTLKMSTDRNGQPITQSRQVTVRAGEESRISFTMPEVRPAVGEESEINNQRPLPQPNR